MKVVKNLTFKKRMKRIFKIILLSPFFVIGFIFLGIGLPMMVSGEWILSKIGAI